MRAGINAMHTAQRIPGHWRQQKQRRGWLRTFLLGIAFLICFLPLAWAILNSLGLRLEDTASPPTLTGALTLDNYGEVGIKEPSFWVEMVTSAAVALVTTFLTISIAFLAAYGLSRSRFRGRRLLVQGFLVLSSLPVMAYVIPLNDLMRRVRLYNTFGGLTLAETAIFVPLALYVVYGYLAGQSREMEEAARLDGATTVQVLWSVVLPTTAAALSATAIIIFVLSWNMYLVPLVITESRVRTLPVAIGDFLTYDRDMDWPTASAGMLTAVLPAIVMVVATHQRSERFSLAPAQENADNLSQS